ncbi:hypothetical protein EV384_5729 [Micromonospora kangleipakensis]|uniref:Glyoxalase/bleomycin resistance protein/dioxygenase superfamily protein n=1 Tax=Micromonospora kangleipakensis TaxID=1077942 RepID=A0A4Q8BG96_9ACTN|nr:hypothetical protein [Micromonospora kangleipakensis]RZU77017.1 hypothetical protein EV384_5729 [Micromonospora kangleipakensis]
MIHHVLLACPPGSEAASRAFYAGLLGMTEKPKPPALAARGGFGMRRFHTHDPHGNRLELLAPIS